MKKILKYVTLFLSISLLYGCSVSNNENQGETAKGEGDRLSIVCTNFALYDWTREILGDNINKVDLTFLLDNGIDVHNYQPSAADMLKIQNSDLFLYIGGESDQWVENLLKSSNGSGRVLKLIDVLGEEAKEEEIIEGMEHDHSEEDEHVASDSDHSDEGAVEDHEESDFDHGEETTIDEHIWLSLKNAEVLSGAIYNEIVLLDNNDAASYKENYDDFKKELLDLDEAYRDFFDAEANKTLVFGDRFPFRYLVDDYHVNYYAAFPGCSAETEASFKTVSFLAEKMNELHLPSIFVIEGSDQSVAKTIIQNSEEKNQAIYVLNSMQSVTAKDIEEGTTYLSIMEDNLQVLKKALEEVR